MNRPGADAVKSGFDGAETEIDAVRRTVRDLLQAEESLIVALSARGLLDARATGVLAAIDQLKAEADQARRPGRVTAGQGGRGH